MASGGFYSSESFIMTRIEQIIMISTDENIRISYVKTFITRKTTKKLKESEV